MVFDRDRPTPSRLSAEAAGALPVLVLFALLLSFAIPGLFARDLWPEDGSAFGRMWTMAHGSARDWWFPNVTGMATAQDGPLPFWFGALAMRALGRWLGELAASRLSVLFWFATAAVSVWAATRRLGRSDRAQPIAPAFGRETEPGDYARVLADIAVLLLVSTLGILVTLHVTSSDTVAIAIVGTALYGLALATERPLAGAALAGTCAGALALSRTDLLAAGLLLGCDVGLGLCAAAGRPRWLAVAVCTACAVTVAASLPVAAVLLAGHAGSALAPGWTPSMSVSLESLGRADAVWLLRNATWYVWPLWPMAAWTLYAWRHHLGAAHIALPACLLAGMLLALPLAAPLNESKLVLAIAPMAVLAAFGFPTLRRALDQWVDWFAISVYTLFIAFVWAYFLALITGTPRAMAASVMRLMPGHTPDASTVPLLVALAVTGIWVALIVWRIRRRPPFLWRGALLSAAGMTCLWLIAVALFLPAANYNRSYRVLAEQLGRRVHSGQCVVAVGMSASLRALIAFDGQLHFARDGATGGCALALQPQYRRSGSAPLPVELNGSWVLVWEGRRPARPDETWRLWRLAR
jgi:4-amino-4-deoxy-L-arabinose transferase-like glycosyltransferase